MKIEIGGEAAEGVSITAHAADVGDTADALEATVEGQPTSIAFNARYLIDVLSNLGAEQAALELSGPLAPGVIRGRRQGRLRPRHHAGPDRLVGATDR